MPDKNEPSMDTNDFRRIALSLEGVGENSHMGKADFRIGGKILATLDSADQGYGNLMLTPEQQAAFIEELPEDFVPIAGGWGHMGMTHIRLAAAKEEVCAPHGNCGSRKTQGRRTAALRAYPSSREAAQETMSIDVPGA
jgi:hypothetical protein